MHFHCNINGDFIRLVSFYFSGCKILHTVEKATTSCKNVETLSRKNNLSCFKSLLVTGLWDKILTFPLPPLKVVPPSFEHGLVLLATLKRGGGGVTSTRSWTSHLSQNTVQCLKYFCNWLSHLRFTSKSDFHVSTSQSEDYSEINK